MCADNILYIDIVEAVLFIYGLLDIFFIEQCSAFCCCCCCLSVFLRFIFHAPFFDAFVRLLLPLHRIHNVWCVFDSLGSTTTTIVTTALANGTNTHSFAYQINTKPNAFNQPANMFVSQALSSQAIQSVSQPNMNFLINFLLFCTHAFAFAHVHRRFRSHGAQN